MKLCEQGLIIKECIAMHANCILNLLPLYIDNDITIKLHEQGLIIKKCKAMCILSLNWVYTSVPN